MWKSTRGTYLLLSIALALDFDAPSTTDHPSIFNQIHLKLDADGDANTEYYMTMAN